MKKNDEIVAIPIYRGQDEEEKRFYNITTSCYCLPDIGEYFIKRGYKREGKKATKYGKKLFALFKKIQKRGKK